MCPAAAEQRESRGPRDVSETARGSRAPAPARSAAVAAPQGKRCRRPLRLLREPGSGVFLRFSFLARPLAQSRAAGARRGREPNTHRPGPELRHGPTPAPSPGESPGPGWPARAGHSRGLGDTRAPAGACAPLCGAIPAEGPVSAEGPASPCPCRGPRAP